MINKEDLALIEEGQKYLDAIRNNEHHPVYSKLFFYMALSEVIKRLSNKYVLNIDVQYIVEIRNRLAHPNHKFELDNLKDISRMFDLSFNDLNSIKEVVSKLLEKQKAKLYESDEIINCIKDHCNKDLYLKFLENYMRLEGSPASIKFYTERNYIILPNGLFNKEELKMISNALENVFGEKHGIYLREISHQKYRFIKSKYKLILFKNRICYKRDNKIYDINTFKEVIE